MNRLSIFLSSWLLFGFVFAKTDAISIENSRSELGNLIKEKERRFQEKFPDYKSRSRIIVAGGSNAFWGIDSNALNKVTKLPIINLALPSEGGDPAMMRALALERAKPGDTIIYSSLDFWIDVDINKKVAWAIANKLGLRSYRAEQSDQSWRERLDAYWKLFPTESNPVQFAKRLLYPVGPSQDDLFTKMNLFGDFIGCTPQAVTPIVKKSAGNWKKFANEIREYLALAESKGVHVVNVEPWILVKPEEKKDWLKYYIKLIDEIAGKPLYQHQYATVVLRTNAAQFCDTNAHLTRDFASLRVKKDIAKRVLALFR